MKNNIVIFGAGNYGRRALDYYGEERVCFFVDNDQKKQGSFLCGKEIRGIESILHKSGVYRIVIANMYSSTIINQLQESGIEDYEVFEDEKLHGYYETNELIVNPYDIVPEALTENEYSSSVRMQYMRQGVYDETEKLYKHVPLFNHIELETINRCNGNCSFCPVNRNVDPREKKIMSKELFESIVDQLAEISYKGRFTTFSNNEPLLDDRIIDFNRYAREKLPDARMHLFTNGTLMTLEKFIALTDILDELIIDNYQQELKLIKPCIEIQEYCETHPELTKKVTIVLRKPQEILTTRGGNAPNRERMIEYGDDRCVLPYKQVIVRPDGKISLCCNDTLGKYTLGDLNHENLVDVWYGAKFSTVRKALYEGRRAWGVCALCDSFSMG